MVEAAIRQRVQDLAKAVRAKDIDAVAAFYAPDIVSFDIDPPLRYAGSDHKRQAWQEMFAAYRGVIGYEVRELDVTSEGDLAFVHSVNHMTGTLANRHPSDMWLRWTACFRRINGMWLIVHDHASVPADLPNERALLHLTP
jgi:uncharacterized protein (TIGR02246 family)